MCRVRDFTLNDPRCEIFSSLPADVFPSLPPPFLILLIVSRRETYGSLTSHRFTHANSRAPIEWSSTSSSYRQVPLFPSVVVVISSHGKGKTFSSIQAIAVATWRKQGAESPPRRFTLRLFACPFTFPCRVEFATFRRIGEA